MASGNENKALNGQPGLKPGIDVKRFFGEVANRLPRCHIPAQTKSLCIFESEDFYVNQLPPKPANVVFGLEVDGHRKVIRFNDIAQAEQQAIGFARQGCQVAIFDAVTGEVVKRAWAEARLPAERRPPFAARMTSAATKTPAPVEPATFAMCRTRP
jgi:hypothetical protein